MNPKPRREVFPRQKKRLSVRRKAVTVCVATIAEHGGSVIGVTDRMLTAGDVEFEPDQAKMWGFSNSIFALVSGDLSIQTEILRLVDNEVKRRIASTPTLWWSVKEVGDLYCKKYRELLRIEAEAGILHPLGLDVQSFLATQASMNPTLVSEIADKLTDFRFESELATIFIGQDHDGPDEEKVYAHIYAAEEDRLRNFTNVGFVAIGMGKFHAESQFMFSGYWPAVPFHQALLLAYTAKKRSEVAPGVGPKTDMVVIGPSLGQSLKVEEKHIEELARIYRGMIRATKKAVRNAEEKTKLFVEAVRKEYEARTAAKKQTDADAKTDDVKQSDSQTSALEQ